MKLLTATVFLPLNWRLKKARPVPDSVITILSKCATAAGQALSSSNLRTAAQQSWQGRDSVMHGDRIQVLIRPQGHKFSTERALICSVPSVWSVPLTLDYSWIFVRSGLVKCQQADFTVMYTNNRLNKDWVAAKLSVDTLRWNVLWCLLSLPSESVTEVRTNIYVTSFGPVSDTDMVSMPPPPPHQSSL